MVGETKALLVDGRLLVDIEVLTRRTKKEFPKWLAYLERRDNPPPPPPPAKTPLEIVLAKPAEELNFRDLFLLKSGKDKWSKLSLAQLEELQRGVKVPDDFDDKNKASCLKWMMRGLPIDKAIRKVDVDRSVAESAIEKSKQLEEDLNSDDSLTGKLARYKFYDC